MAVCGVSVHAAHSQPAEPRSPVYRSQLPRMRHRCTAMSTDRVSRKLGSKI